MSMTIEEAIGPGHWYGARKVACLNDAGDLLLIDRWAPVDQVRVVKGSDDTKIDALLAFRPEQLDSERKALIHRERGRSPKRRRAS